MKLCQWVTAISVLLAGCATPPSTNEISGAFTTELKKVNNFASNVTQICADPDVKALSSPQAILADLKTGLEADFGLSSNPSDAPDKTNIQLTLNDLQNQFATIKAEDQQSVAQIKSSIAALKTDVTTVRSDIENKFSTWTKSEQSECKANPLSCVIPTIFSVEQLAQTMQADAGTLVADAQNAETAIKVDLNTLAKNNSVAATHIRDDIQKLEAMALILKQFVDAIVEPQNKNNSSSANQANQAITAAIKQTVKDSFDKYLAYEAAFQTENLVTQLARDTIAKIDSLTGQTFGLSLLVATAAEGGLYEFARPEIRKLALDARDSTKKSNSATSQFEGLYYNALVAQSCSRMAQDSNSLDSNAARAQLFLAPIHLDLICDANYDAQSKIISCWAPPQPTPAAAPADTASTQTPPTNKSAADSPSNTPFKSVAVEDVNAKVKENNVNSPSNKSTDYVKQVFSKVYLAANAQAAVVAPPAANPRASTLRGNKYGGMQAESIVVGVVGQPGTAQPASGHAHPHLTQDNITASINQFFAQKGPPPAIR